MQSNNDFGFVSTTPRITIMHDAGALSIVIPGRQHRVALFLVPWLFMWAIGWTDAMHQILSGHPAKGMAFTSFWMIGWTFGGCFAFYKLAWMMVGRTCITVAQGALSLRREIAGIGRTRLFDTDSITGLRFVLAGNIRQVRGPSFRAPSFVKVPTVAFDYGMRTYWIGRDDVDEAESHAIMVALRQAGLNCFISMSLAKIDA